MNGISLIIFEFLSKKQDNFLNNLTAEMYKNTQSVDSKLTYQ